MFLIKLWIIQFPNFLDGIIVLDKPYGIGHWRDFEVKNVRSNYHPKTFETLSLKDVLDEMASKLGYEALTIKKGPDRHVVKFYS